MKIENINFLILIRFMKNFVIFGPFVIIYGNHIGMSSKEMVSVFTLFSTLFLILDLPCGHLADKIGHRQALALGMFLYGSGSLLLGLWNTSHSMWIAQIFFALGQSIHMGSDSGLSYLMLSKHNRHSSFSSIERKVLSIYSASNFFICVIGGRIAAYSFEMIFIVTAILQFLTVGLCYFLPDLKSLSTKERYTIKIKIKKFIEVFVAQRSFSPLLGFFLFSAAMRLIFFTIPADVYSKINNVEKSAYFIGSAALVSFLYFMIRKHLPKNTVKKSIPPLFCLAGIFLCMDHLAFTFMALVIFNITLIEFIPILMEYFMHHFGHMGEATAMSLISTGNSIFIAICGPLSTYLAAQFGISSTFVIFFSGCLGLLIFYPMSKHNPVVQSLHGHQCF